MRKSKLVKYSEYNKKHESRFAKYIFTNEKILSKCHDYKHESNFEIWVETKKIRVDVKKKGESSKRNRWSVKLSIDVSTLGFDPKWRFVGFQI